MTSRSMAMLSALRTPHVPERRVRDVRVVDGVVVGAQARHARGLVGQLLLQRGVLSRRQRLEMVELSGPVAGERLVDVVDDQSRDLLDDHVAGVPVERVLHPRVVLVERYLPEGVGAVRDHVPGRGPVAPVGFDRRPVRGEEGGVGGHRREVGQRRVQPHLQGVVVEGLHAELGGRRLAGEDGLGVDHLGELQVPPVGRGGGGVDRAPPGVDEVVRGDRIAVRPPGVLAKREGVGRVAVGGLVVRGHAGNEVPRRILAEESFEEIANDVKARSVLVQLRIEGRELIEEAVGEGLVPGQRLPGHGVSARGLRRCARGEGERRQQRAQRGGETRVRESGAHDPLLRTWLSPVRAGVYAPAAPRGRRAGDASLRRAERRSCARSPVVPVGRSGSRPSECDTVNRTGPAAPPIRRLVRQAHEDLEAGDELTAGVGERYMTLRVVALCLSRARPSGTRPSAGRTIPDKLHRPRRRGP